MTKDEIVDKAKEYWEKVSPYWEKVLILALVAVCIILWQQQANSRAEVEKLKANLQRQDTIRTIEKQHDEVIEREKTYPDRDKKIEDSRKKKEEVKKEVARETKNADINRLAELFRDAGYPCEVVSR